MKHIKLFSIFILFIHAILINITSQSSECGGLLETSLAARFLTYKLNENYNSNELCVWTFKNNWAGSRLILQLEDEGFGESGDFLEIFTQGSIRDENGNFVEGIHQGKHFESLVYANGTLRKKGDVSSMAYPLFAMVVFKSLNNVNSRGFNMSYVKGHSSSTYIAPVTNFENSKSFGFMEWKPLLVREYQYYSWTIYPNLENNFIVIHKLVGATYFNFLNVYAGTNNESTLLAAFNSNLDAPYNISISGRVPIFLYYYSRFSENEVELQFYWNQNVPPEFIKNLSTTSASDTNSSISKFLKSTKILVVALSLNLIISSLHH